MNQLNVRGLLCLPENNRCDTSQCTYGVSTLSEEIHERFYFTHVLETQMCLCPTQFLRLYQVQILTSQNLCHICC